jgi:hemerythrin
MFDTVEEQQQHIDNLVTETHSIMWEEKYSIDNELVDHQHQRLFEIARNALRLKATHRQDKVAHDKLKEIIQELFDYTVKHFHDEEEYQKEIGYPGLEDHKVIHQNILSLFKDFVLKLNNLSIEEIEDGLYGFVKEYFIHHITGADKDIGLWYDKNCK